MDLVSPRHDRRSFTVCAVANKPVNVCHYPENRMKKATLLVLFCVLASLSLLAQVPTDSPVDAIRHPGWNAGIFVGGGHTVDTSPNAGNFLIGTRLGRVLTNEHGKGILRGTYEMDIDIIPLDEYWIRGGQYSGGINPVVFKWNFTHGCKIAFFSFHGLTSA